MRTRPKCCFNRQLGTCIRNYVQDNNASAGISIRRLTTSWNIWNSNPSNSSKNNFYIWFVGQIRTTDKTILQAILNWLSIFLQHSILIFGIVYGLGYSTSQHFPVFTSETLTELAMWPTVITIIILQLCCGVLREFSSPHKNLTSAISLRLKWHKLEKKKELWFTLDCSFGKIMCLPDSCPTYGYLTLLFPLPGLLPLQITHYSQTREEYGIIYIHLMPPTPAPCAMQH